MVFKLTESRDSQESTTTPPSLVYRYNATGSNDRAYVQAYALAATPGIVAGPLGALLHRQDVAVKPAGFECWTVEVPYAEKTIDTGALDIEFDTTGGSVHITASKQTINTSIAGVNIRVRDVTTIRSSASGACKSAPWGNC